MVPCIPSQVSFRVQYPEDYQGLSYEDLREFKHTRYGNNCFLLFFFVVISMGCQPIEVGSSGKDGFELCLRMQVRVLLLLFWCKQFHWAMPATVEGGALLGACLWGGLQVPMGLVWPKA